jgi:hypothetical protein
VTQRELKVTGDIDPNRKLEDFELEAAALALEGLEFDDEPEEDELGEWSAPALRLGLVTGIIEWLAEHEVVKADSWSILAALGHIFTGRALVWSITEVDENQGGDISARAGAVTELAEKLWSHAPEDAGAAIRAAGYILFGDDD